MKKQQIEDEAIKYSSGINFIDDNILSEKGREGIREWSRRDFTAGGLYVIKQLISLESMGSNNTYTSDKELADLYNGLEKSSLVKMLIKKHRQLEALNIADVSGSLPINKREFKFLIEHDPKREIHKIEFTTYDRNGERLSSEDMSVNWYDNDR